MSNHWFINTVKHDMHISYNNKFASCSLSSLFSTNMAISETKGHGWTAIPTQWRKASKILTSTLAAFLFSSHPKRERGREAHLNYYTSAYNSRRQLSHCKTKQNQIQQKQACILNYKTHITQKQHTHKETKARFSGLLQIRPGNGVGLFW